MVEFAFLLPVLLVIVIGILDFGQAFNYWNNLNQMAGDAARFAAVNSTGPATSVCSKPAGTTLTANISRQAEASYLCGKVATCLQAFNASGQPEGLASVQVGDSIKVVTSAPYNFTNFQVLGSIGTVTLHGNATMRVERVSADPANPGASNLGTAC